MGLIADYTLQKKISELEDITTETTQNENKEIRQRKKKHRKRRISRLWENFKRPNLHVKGVEDDGKRKNIWPNTL